MISSIKNFAGKHLTTSQIVNTGLSAYAGIEAYNDARENNRGTVSSAFSGALEGIMSLRLGFAGYLGIQLATEAPFFARDMMRAYDMKKRMLSQEMYAQPFSNSYFNDTEQAFTMRQAGMQMANNNRYSMQNAMLGNEAKYMHR